MQKLFVAAALAASTFAVDDYCCELYVEENYGGYRETACLPTNFQDAHLKSFAFSFHHLGGIEPMNDALGSYKCGLFVKADFCLEEPFQYHDDDNLKQYKCNNIGFGNENGGQEDPGPLEEMNLISSIVLYEGTPVVKANECKQTTFYTAEDCRAGGGETFLPNLIEPQVTMGTGEFLVKSIWLQERAKIELFSEIRWGGAQVNQKNTFQPIPDQEKEENAENNCICINLGDHEGTPWFPMSFKHYDLDQ